MTPPTNTKKPHISQTQLVMYEKCGEQYRRRYLEKDIVSPGFALLKGRAVHDGARANFRQKIESHIDLPKKEVIDISVAVLGTELHKGFAMTPDEEKIGKDIMIDTTQQSVITLAGLFIDQVAPEYQPEMVEVEQRIVLEAASHDLVAKMDLADILKRVVDLKTSTKKKPADEVHTSEQLTFYALVYLAVKGYLPAAVLLENLIDKKEPERQVLQSQRDQKDLQTLICRLNTMIGGLKAGVFIPAPASSWACNPRWCGYAPTCQYYSNRGHTVPEV
jgi:hypothetical protein